MTMDPRNKALLLAALRSGEYVQTSGLLRRKDDGQEGFCCLGVACDVYHRATGRGAWEEICSLVGSNWVFKPARASQGENATLPIAVAEWFGCTGNPSVGITDVDRLFAGRVTPLRNESEVPLTVLNDRYHFTFAEIADVIEECL